MTEQTRRFGWKAVIGLVTVVALVWLVVVQRDRLRESVGLVTQADWTWVLAAVVAQAVSMGAMARQQRRLGRRPRQALSASTAVHTRSICSSVSPDPDGR